MKEVKTNQKSQIQSGCGEDIGLQIQVEAMALATYLSHPKSTLTASLTPEHFTKPEFRDVFAWMIAHPSFDGSLRIEDMVRDLGEWVIDVYNNVGVENVLSSALLPVYEQKLEELRKKRVIGELNCALSEGTISVEEYAERIGNSLAVKPPEEPEMTEEEIFKLITTADQILHFEEFECFRYGLPLAECRTHVLAGYTSRGKSALAMNMALDLARSHKVLYFNLEMADQDVWRRLVAYHSEVQINYMTSAPSSPEMSDLLKEGIRAVKKTGIKVYTGSKTLEQIVAKIQQNAYSRPVVIIDHIQYVQTSRRSLEERERLSEIMKTMNGLAKDGKCTPIILSQINRSGSEEATLNNLQGSAAIAQDADNVMIVEYTDKDQKNADIAQVKLKVDKARSAQTGEIYFLFDKKIQKFKGVRK